MGGKLAHFSYTSLAAGEDLMKVGIQEWILSLKRGHPSCCVCTVKYIEGDHFETWIWSTRVYHFSSNWKAPFFQLEGKAPFFQLKGAPNTEG
jgi:hypothetical protein